MLSIVALGPLVTPQTYRRVFIVFKNTSKKIRKKSSVKKTLMHVTYRFSKSKYTLSAVTNWNDSIDAAVVLGIN